MLYKDFRNLPYGSLCVLSIVKRAAVFVHLIAKDFDRGLPRRLGAATFRIGPDAGPVVSAFLTGADGGGCGGLGPRRS